MASTVSTFVSTGATVPVGTNIWMDTISSGGSLASSAVVEYVKIADGAAGSTLTWNMSSGSALDGPGLPVNVVNSSKTPIGVVLTGGQSSVTVSGTVTTTQSTAAVSSGNALGAAGLQVNVVNSTSFPIGVSLTGGQSSVTVTGAVTVNFSNSNSTTNAILSTAGMGGSTGAPIYVQVLPNTPAAGSTYSNNKITSTATATPFSSAASTSFNLTGIIATNKGATLTVMSIWTGSTAGTLLFQNALSSGGGGFVWNGVMNTPRGSTGSQITVECVPASTIYLHLDAYKSS